MSKNSLDSFELYYEEMERKPVKTAKSTKKVVKSKPQKVLVLRGYLANALTTVRGKIDNVRKHSTQRRKKAKRMTKTERSLIRQKKIRGIIGIGLLFVVVSIAYSTYMTNLFVDGWRMAVALTPQVIFAVVISFYAFYKIFK